MPTVLPRWNITSLNLYMHPALFAPCRCRVQGDERLGLGGRRLCAHKGCPHLLGLGGGGRE